MTNFLFDKSKLNPLQGFISFNQKQIVINEWGSARLKNDKIGQKHELGESGVLVSQIEWRWTSEDEADLWQRPLDAAMRQNQARARTATTARM